MTTYYELFEYGGTILRDGSEWRYEFRSIPVVGFADSAINAACRNFTRVEDNRKPAQPPAPIQLTLWERAA